MAGVVNGSNGTNGTNGVNGVNGDAHREPKKLVLCFDGTGNTFSGSNADTNVVKILSKLDRNDPNQFHYYQTGIGTYDINETSVNKTWYGEFKSSVSQTLDQGFGTTFDAHVIAGYRFLMRYYDSGDKIYMFGFSRGSFTAKFLARMIFTVGLLCKGNEEMVPFAYRLYQRYLAGEVAESTTSTDAAADTDGASSEHVAHRHHWARDEITAFSNTFCRKEKVRHCGKVEERNIKVYFLGMWDCVSSVAVLEREAPKPMPVKGTAQFVRHAVAVDERRVKFKAALLAQDIRAADEDEDGDDEHAEDIKEVWFPGCHGDVGGGWPASNEDGYKDPAKDDGTGKPSFWQRMKTFWATRKPKEPSRDIRLDPYQMSDIPLAWMIREVELVGRMDPPAAVKWTFRLHGFRRRFNKDQALRGFMHDSLRFSHGTGFFKVLLWKFMEWLPIIKRWELSGNEWVNVRFPLNKGATRDIPPDAVLHESLLWRLRNNAGYHPCNNHGGYLPPCLKHNGQLAEVLAVPEPEDQADPDHQTYKFAKPPAH